MWAYVKSFRLLVCVFVSSLVSFEAASQVYRPGEVIVKLKGNSKSVTATSFLGKVQLEKRMALKNSWRGMNMHRFKSTTGHTTQQLMDQYRDDPAVQYVEPNYIFRKMDVEGSAGGVHAAGDFSSSSSGTFSQNSAAINVEESWQLLSSGNEEPVVAVIDTGVDTDHQVFTQAGAMWINEAEANGSPGVDDDGNGFVDDINGWDFANDDANPDDDNGHGTHVAGIILGMTQDIVNTNPVAPAKMKIMALKFLDSAGSGATNDAIDAIYYAVRNGAKIINNSWGGGSYSAALHEALVFAYNSKAFVTAAAGNETTNNDLVPTYPANYDVPSLASIAATTDSDNLASFSNFGSATVHVGAPGSQIYSTFPNNNFGNSSGTSMAAPLVAGMAAMMMYEQPEMTGFQLKQIIFNEGQAVGSLASKTTTKNRVNAYHALASAKGATIDSSQPAYDVTVDQFGRDLASSLDGGACGLVGKTGAGSPPPPFYIIVLISILLAPLFVAKYLRKDTLNRRKHERFEIDSDVSLNLGGKKMRGRVSSISQGGVQLDTEELLEKGSVISMSIRSPDGDGEILVEGNIVWSEEKKHYGVQFLETAATAASIGKITKNLKPEEG